MCKTVSILATFAVSAIATASQAQVGDMPTPEERGRIAALNDDFGQWTHQTGWMGIRWIAAFQNYAGMISIFSAPTKEGAPSGRPTRVRFVAKQIERRANEPDVIGWADSDSCPALMMLVESWEELDAPRTRVTGLRFPYEFPNAVLDGTTWTIWSRSAVQEGNMPATVLQISNAGPIREWSLAARERLSTCWRAEEPPRDF